MITDEKLNNLYNIVEASEEITTKELKELGFNSNDITNLVNSGTIKRVRRGFYVFFDVEKLISWGRYISKTDAVKAIKIFDRCYRLDPTNEDVLLLLILHAVISEDYDVAQRYLNELTSCTKNTEILEFAKLFMYLLNELLGLSNNIVLNIQMFKFDDEHPNKLFVVQNILSGDYKEAIHVLNKPYCGGLQRLTKMVIKKLLQRVIGKRNSEDLNNLILNVRKGIEDKNVQSILENLHKSLEVLNALKYEQLMINLIKLSIEERDMSYIMKALNSLSSSSFVIDIDSLLNVFNKKLENNLFSGADLVIKIMYVIKRRNLDNRVTDELIKELQEKLDSKKQTYEKKPSVLVDSKTELVRKYEELFLSDSNILVLSPEESELFNVDSFNDTYGRTATSFAISFDDMRMVVVKKTKYVANLQQVLQQANAAYRAHRVDEAISLFETLLLTRKSYSSTFAKLGFLYKEKGDILTSVMYLKVATGLAKSATDEGNNFTKMIHRLEGEMVAGEEKEFIKMNEDDFTSEDNYGVPKINDVCILMNYQGFSLDDACQALAILDDDKYMIALLLAKDAYTNGDITFGDKFLKMIEKAKNKSPRVNEFLIEVRRNKLFYKSRRSDDFKPMLRTRAM